MLYVQLPCPLKEGLKEKRDILVVFMYIAYLTKQVLLCTSC